MNPDSDNSKKETGAADGMITEFEKAFTDVRELAWNTNIEIVFENEQALKILNKKLKGFVFYENI